MKVIEFPYQTGVRLTPQPGWQVQPQPIRLRASQTESLAEFLGIINDPEFQRSVGRILATEAFGGNADIPVSPIETAAYRRSAFDEAGRVFDFLLESARLNHRDRQAANQQRDLQRRMFARNVSDDAAVAVQHLLPPQKKCHVQSIAAAR